MNSPNGLGIVMALCVIAAMILTAPIWVAFGAIVYAVLTVMF